MRKTLALITACLAALFCLAPSSAGQTVSFRSADAGQYQGAVEMSTPWGDYVALDQGGGDYLVMTGTEYEHARVKGISRDIGFRETRVSAPGAAMSFVQDTSLKTQIGSHVIDGITPSIDTTQSPANARFFLVNVTWIGQGSPGCILYSPGLKKTFLPIDIDRSQPPYTNEAFSLPRSQLTKKTLLFFAYANMKPSLLAVSSIAKLDYEISHQSATMAGTTPDAKETNHLRALTQIDPTITR